MSDFFTIGAGTIYRFYKSLVEIGVSEEKISPLINLKLNDLKDNDQRVPVEKYFTLGKESPKLTNRPEIGLILGQKANYRNIGIIYHLARSCKTLRESLVQTVRYSNLGNEITSVYILENRHFAEWSEKCQIKTYLCIPLIELECCQKFKLLKHVIGNNFSPAQIKLQYRRPDYYKKYSSIFQCPVLFEQDTNGIVFDKKYLDSPNPTPDPYIKNILSKHADNLIEDLRRSKHLSDKIKNVIMVNLESGTVSLDMIAEELKMSNRTVCRKLKEEHVTFKQLVSDVQKQLASKYLMERSISIDEISFLLGFSESSAFIRAFKRWFGMPPGRYRLVHTANK